jgi:hypothetical protein
MPEFPPRPRSSGARRHRVGAGLPLFTTCADVDAYQAALGAAIQGYQDDLAKANAFGNDDFSARWFKYFGDWQAFNAEECHWYSWGDSHGRQSYRVDRMMQFHDALIAFQTEKPDVKPSMLPPDPPVGPSMGDPKKGDTLGNTLTTMAIAGTVIVSVWGAVRLVELFKGGRE